LISHNPELLKTGFRPAHEVDDENHQVSAHVKILTGIAGAKFPSVQFSIGSYTDFVLAQGMYLEDVATADLPTDCGKNENARVTEKCYGEKLQM
jgi:hypothetical protein